MPLNTTHPPYGSIRPRFWSLWRAGCPLKPGDNHKIKLKINGKRYDALFQRPDSAREYRIVYDSQSNAAHALREYLGDNLKTGEAAFTIRSTGKAELIAEQPGRAS